MQVQDVKARLSEIGHRLAVNSSAFWGAFVIVVGAILACLLVWFSIIPSSLVVPLGVVFAGLCVGALVYVLSAKRIDYIARKVEFDLDLQQEMSTALDVDAKNKPETVLSRALQAQAAQKASALDVRVLAPIWRMRNTIVTALAALFLGVLVAISIEPKTVDTVITPDSLAHEVSEEIEQDEVITVDEVQAMADLIAEDALRRNNDYLQSVADSLSQLAQDFPDLTEEQIEADLSALLEHARAGYDRNMPKWLQDNQQSVAQVAQAALDTKKWQDEMLSMPGFDPDDPYAFYEEDPYFLKGRKDARELSKKLAEENRAESDILDSAAQESSGDASDAAGMASDAMQPQPMDDSDQQIEAAGAIPIGAAQQSGKGESNLAGDGTQSLVNNTDYLETMADPTEDMLLAGEQGEGGATIRMLTSPDVQATETEGGRSVSQTVWERQSAQAVDRFTISPSSADVVAHYFNRSRTSQGR